MIRDFPDQQESITYILISTALESVYDLMHYLSNSINKLHDIFLQYFSGTCEVMNVTEPKDSTLFPAWQHWVQVTLLSHIQSNDFTTSFTKT